MSKPSKDELEIALKQAVRLKEKRKDEFFMAKCLLNFNYRIRFLEDVLHKANLYLHSGDGAHEHAELVKAIERAEQASRFPGEEDPDTPPW